MMDTESNIKSLNQSKSHIKLLFINLTDLQRQTTYLQSDVALLAFLVWPEILKLSRG